VPDPTNPDQVLESALRHRSVNPIFFAESDDHGVKALSDWLVALGRIVDAMTRARLRPFSDEPQWALAEKVKELVVGGEYQPQVRKAVAGLVDRPDLLRYTHGTFDELAFNDLCGRIGLHEARQIFVELNRAKRDSSLEQLLSALPPSRQ
jgi:hypothetical protein